MSTITEKCIEVIGGLLDEKHYNSCKILSTFSTYFWRKSLKEMQKKSKSTVDFLNNSVEFTTRAAEILEVDGGLFEHLLRENV